MTTKVDPLLAAFEEIADIIKKYRLAGSVVLSTSDRAAGMKLLPNTLSVKSDRTGQGNNSRLIPNDLGKDRRVDFRTLTVLSSMTEASSILLQQYIDVTDAILEYYEDDFEFLSALGLDEKVDTKPQDFSSAGTVRKVSELTVVPQKSKKSKKSSKLVPSIH